jgi:hypothetical protein
MNSKTLHNLQNLVICGKKCRQKIHKNVNDKNVNDDKNNSKQFGRDYLEAHNIVLKRDYTGRKEVSVEVR